MDKYTEQVIVFEPDIRVHPVDELMEFSKKHHYGFVYMGERLPLIFPEEEDGFIWYPKRMFPKPIHKGAIHRHEHVERDLPHIKIDGVVIGDEIDENPQPSWEERAEEFQEKLAAGSKDVLPTIAKIGLVALGVGVLCAVGVGVVGAAAAAASVPAVVAVPVAAPVVGSGVLPLAAVVGLLALDPKYVLIVSDGRTMHGVCIFSWLD